MKITMVIKSFRDSGLHGHPLVRGDAETIVTVPVSCRRDEVDDQLSLT